VTSLSGNRGDTNQAGNVNFTQPQHGTAAVEAERKTFSYSFAANSFTLLKLSDSGVMMTLRGLLSGMP